MSELRQGSFDFAQRFAGETLRSAKDDIDFGAGDLVLAMVPAFW
jgi:hypothetical protein